MRPPVLAAALAAILFAPFAAHAQFNGASVTGYMWFDGDTGTNFFDATNKCTLTTSCVPDGYGNSGSSGDPTVVVSEPLIEFGYDDNCLCTIGTPYHAISLNLSDSQIVLTDFSSDGDLAAGVTYTLISSAFIGQHIDLVSSDFPGGLFYSHDGDTFTITTPKYIVPNDPTYTATFVIPAPEPASLSLLAAGALGIGAIRRRRRR